MGCACRTTSLRIFVQSLTEIRVSNSTITATRPIQPRYLRATSFQSPLVFSRSFSATIPLNYPRQSFRGLISKLKVTHKPVEYEKHKSPADATVNTVKPLNATEDDLYRAKSGGAILDFSPESIDALVSDIGEEPTKAPTPRVRYTQSNVTYWSKPDPAVPKELPEESPEGSFEKSFEKSFKEPFEESPKRSSRLKRLKIIKPPKTEPKRSYREKKEHWRIQKEALKEKFPEGWRPIKRLSPDALEGIRALHSQFPGEFPTHVLAQKFEVSPEVIRRILKSKWRPNSEEEIERQERWFNRGKSVWAKKAELGVKPPRRWRNEGIVRDPIWNQRKGPRTQPRKQRSHDPWELEYE
ncbi:hypothetical protein F4804DRAFT_326744 [Jackrogersella minutella]|nr:hypothetical protein F4804DRAFT_326744 [Jackrogersella minutella]